MNKKIKQKIISATKAIENIIDAYNLDEQDEAKLIMALRIINMCCDVDSNIDILDIKQDK